SIAKDDRVATLCCGAWVARTRSVSMSALSPLLTPGCVKTLEAIVGAQQKNRSHSLDESFMRGRPSLCINLVPERPIEWFSHSQDPTETLAAQDFRSAKVTVR